MFLLSSDFFCKVTLYFLNNGNLIAIFCDFLHKTDIKQAFLEFLNYNS